MGWESGLAGFAGWGESGKRELGARGKVLRTLEGLGRWFVGRVSWWEIGTVCECSSGGAENIWHLCLYRQLLRLSVGLACRAAQAEGKVVILSFEELYGGAERPTRQSSEPYTWQRLSSL